MATPTPDAAGMAPAHTRHCDSWAALAAAWGDPLDSCLHKMLGNVGELAGIWHSQKFKKFTKRAGLRHHIYPNGWSYSGRLGFSKPSLPRCASILPQPLQSTSRIRPGFEYFAFVVQTVFPKWRHSRIIVLSITLVKESATWAPDGTHLIWIPFCRCSFINFAWRSVLNSWQLGGAVLPIKSYSDLPSGRQWWLCRYLIWVIDWGVSGH